MTKQKEIEEANFNPDNYVFDEEVESPNFFKFEKVGDKINGILTNKDVSTRYGFGLYSMQQSDGTRIRFHGSAQLDDLLEAIQPPEIIEIEYIDSQETPSGNMKLFKVKRGRRK